MAHEWRSLDEAEIRVGAEAGTGELGWSAVIPRDDGTVAAGVTAMRLTYTDERPLVVDGRQIPVARPGRPGAPSLPARSERRSSWRVRGTGSNGVSPMRGPAEIRIPPVRLEWAAIRRQGAWAAGGAPSRGSGFGDGLPAGTGADPGAAGRLARPASSDRSPSGVRMPARRGDGVSQGRIAGTGGLDDFRCPTAWGRGDGGPWCRPGLAGGLTDRRSDRDGLPGDRS